VKYLTIMGLLGAFVVTTVCGLKAQWIRDYLLNWTARAYGSSSVSFRLQKWFVGNSFHVVGVRIVASVAAACMLAAMIYLIVADHKR
jgi:Gpi18-like mannosyltransferase